MIEANVIYRISHGDEKALDAFMDYYSSMLYRYALGITGDKESAEEVVSDVFYDVWKQGVKILDIVSMDAFLRTLTYRRAISYLRHIKTLPVSVSLDNIDYYTVLPIAAPDNELINKEEIDALNSAIETLPPKSKQVFYLAKIEQLPYKEISKLLNISVPTINYHIAYAMGVLKKKLKGMNISFWLLILCLDIF